LSVLSVFAVVSDVVPVHWVAPAVPYVAHVRHVRGVGCVPGVAGDVVFRPAKQARNGHPTLRVGDRFRGLFVTLVVSVRLR